MSVNTLEQRLSKVSWLKEKKDYDLALKECESVIQDYPETLQAYRLKADILSLQKKIDEALVANIRLSELGSTEPSDYFDLARRGLPMGKNVEVIEWCEKGISLCEKHEAYYYVQSLYFYKACAELNTGKYSNAIASCSRIEDNYSVYIYGHGNKSKEEVLKKSRHQLRNNHVRVIRFD